MLKTLRDLRKGLNSTGLYGGLPLYRPGEGVRSGGFTEGVRGLRVQVGPLVAYIRVPKGLEP